MTLFITMLPLYLLGNLHCAAMCGPLAMLIKQRRHFYFLGRMTSFSLAGMLAGEIGSVVGHLLGPFAAATSLMFGLAICLMGLLALFKVRLPLPQGISAKLAPLMLIEKGWATFAFGLATVLLPCGQTAIVFTACALAGSAWTGLFNGFAFALLTSPSLYMAMRLRGFTRAWANPMMGLLALVVGVLAVCRGLADLEIVPHLIVGPHLVLF